MNNDWTKKAVSVLKKSSVVYVATAEDGIYISNTHIAFHTKARKIALQMLAQLGIVSDVVANLDGRWTKGRRVGDGPSYTSFEEKFKNHNNASPIQFSALQLHVQDDIYRLAANGDVVYAINNIYMQIVDTFNCQYTMTVACANDDSCELHVSTNEVDMIIMPCILAEERRNDKNLIAALTTKIA